MDIVWASRLGKNVVWVWKGGGKHHKSIAQVTNLNKIFQVKKNPEI